MHWEFEGSESWFYEEDGKLLSKLFDFGWDLSSFGGVERLRDDTEGGDEWLCGSAYSCQKWNSHLFRQPWKSTSTKQRARTREQTGFGPTQHRALWDLRKCITETIVEFEA